jgi:hypothetical protein
MKWLFFGFVMINSLWAQTSRIIPPVLEASRLYVAGVTNQESLYLQPDILAALSVLESKKVDPLILDKYTHQKSTVWKLRADDQYDQWLKKPVPEKLTEVPEIAVHAFKFKVQEASDNWFKDDIYAYFFITDGVIPTGKVTSIYKGLSNGQSFFFNEIDRAIFPLVGITAKRPENHLIIDYGIVESDGDDIKELQALSSIIIDIAIAVYASYDPQNAQILINLRKEVKALAEMLLGLNNDDRLVTSTLAYKSNQIEEMLKNESYVEITRKHHSKAALNSWEYDLSFRFIRK